MVKVTIPKINNAHGPDTRNIINRAIDVINVQGKSVQDLVAKGQLTPAQYATLIQTVNGLIAKGDVTFDDIDINQGKMLPKHLSEEVLSMIAGDAPVNAVPADGSITTEKVAKKAIDPVNTNFIKVPNNLINKRNVIENKSMDTSTGVPVDNPNTVVTNFIKVDPETTYTCKNTSRFYVYKDDKSFLSSNVLNTYTTPEDGHYLRFSIAKTDLDTAQVNKGNTLKPYDEYVFEIGDEKEIPFSMKLPEKSVGTHELKENSVKPENTTFIKKSTNLYNKETALINKAVERPSGNIVDLPGNFISELIPVTPGEKYTKKNAERWFSYDSNKTYISTSVTETYQIPPTAFYVRISGYSDKVNKAQMNAGSVALEYQEYGNSLDKDLLSNVDGEKDFDWVDDKIYHIDGKVDGIYKSIELESKGSGTTKPLTSYSVSDYYDDYDALMAKYPDYITKTLLGYDASGTFPIYRYDFIPPRPKNHGNYSDVTLPKAVLMSGSHPERMGIWCLFKTMESIAERWKQDEFLATLHNNLHFIVLPLWSPWNVDNGTRWNSNLVNVGRNFPESFVKLPVEDSKYGGTEPLSEPEAQYLHKILTEEKDILFKIDFHNFFTTENFLWTETKSAAMGMIGDQHIYKMTGEWKKRYPQIPQEDSHYVGYTTIKGEAKGSSFAFAESIGIRGITYEVSEYLYFEVDQPRYSSMAITLGTEAFTNYLLSIFKYTVNEKNGYK